MKIEVIQLNEILLDGKPFNSIIAALKAAGGEAKEVENSILTFEGEIRQKLVRAETEVTRLQGVERAKADVAGQLREALEKIEVTEKASKVRRQQEETV